MKSAKIACWVGKHVGLQRLSCISIEQRTECRNGPRYRMPLVNCINVASSEFDFDISRLIVSLLLQGFS